MDGSDILSFVRNPAFFNQASVHERLYNDFSRRSHHKKIIENGTQSYLVKKPSPLRLTEQKIEDLLMIKYKASQGRLKQLRARYQSEEMREMKQVPDISQNSKILASFQCEVNLEVKSQYINAILNNSRLSRMNRASSLGGLSKSAVIKIDNDSTIVYNSFEDYEKSKRVSRTLSGTKEKNKYLNELRELVSQRPNVMKHEEPPNILEMTVIERGKYWSNKKKKKIEHFRDLSKELELQKCTFSPDITPLQGLLQHTPKTSCSLNLSYSQLYLNKKTSTNPKISEKPKPITPKLHPNQIRKESFSSLSPVRQKLAHKSGVDLLKFFKKSKLISKSSVNLK